MPANINDKITSVRSGSSNANVTTVASARSIGGTSLSCVDLSNWPTDSAVHFITYKKKADGSMDKSTQCDWKGVVASNTIGSLTLKNGEDAGNAVGDFVEMAPTAAWSQDLHDGLAATLNQDGTLQTGIVTTDALADGSVTTDTLAEGAATSLLLSNIEVADFANALNIPATTWTDIRSNQSFTVSSSNSTVAISISCNSILGTAAGGGNVVVRAVIDSAGTPQYYKIAGNYYDATVNYVNPFCGISTFYVTGLSAGSHTIKVQLYSLLANKFYCRPATNAYEAYATYIVELKK